MRQSLHLLLMAAFNGGLLVHFLHQSQGWFLPAIPAFAVLCCILATMLQRDNQ